MLVQNPALWLLVLNEDDVLALRASLQGENSRRLERALPAEIHVAFD